MFKYIKFITAFALLPAACMTSCKKSFLEVVPKGSLIATTYSDYNLLMNSSAFYLLGNIGVWQPAMLMGDEVGAEATYFNMKNVPAPSRALFQWSDDVFLPSSSSATQNPQFLTTLLPNIYTCNKIINEVLNASDGSEQQKMEVQAEAMATRAWTYYQLINYFGKPYNAVTAVSDPGWPINTTTDIATGQYNRNTVQEVYDFIIKDLTTAIPNLQIQPPVATRMSKAAAEGILGKVYLSMQKNTEALAMFNAAFNDIMQMASPPSLYDYNVTFAPGGSFLPINNISGPTSPFNNQTDLTESVLATISYSGNRSGASGNGYGNDYLTISPQTAALFDPSDWRLQFYTNLQQDHTPNPGGRLRKYGVTFSRIGLQLPDLYLLRAESKARANDLTGAVTDVETLRQHRMPAANAAVAADTAANQTLLIKFILNERIREFASEGYRWWDMRRLSTDPLFSGQPAAVHILYGAAGVTTSYTLKPERLTLRIPAYYLSHNPGMADNP